MNELLSIAVQAHGGLDRWNQLSRLQAELSITGGLWHVKGKPDVLKHVTFKAHTQDQHMSVGPFSAQDLRGFFEPGCLSLTDASDQLVAQRDNPRMLFIGHKADTPWDDLHVAYFSNYALWCYLTAPFLYTYPGFVTEELSPWEDSGEQWRRLKITFPEHFASHCEEQISYFGADGLLRRHDYEVEILGGSKAAHYVSEYRDFDGIKVPTQRRVYRRGEQGQKIPEPLLVGIDVQSLMFS